MHTAYFIRKKRGDANYNYSEMQLIWCKFINIYWHVHIYFKFWAKSCLWRFVGNAIARQHHLSRHFTFCEKIFGNILCNVIPHCPITPTIIGKTCVVINVTWTIAVFRFPPAYFPNYEDDFVRIVWIRVILEVSEVKQGRVHIWAIAFRLFQAHTDRIIIVKRH